VASPKKDQPPGRRIIFAIPSVEKFTSHGRICFELGNQFQRLAFSPKEENNFSLWQLLMRTMSAE
jgi:hypothetical protein